MGVDAEFIEQHPHLTHVITAAKSQQAWSQQIHSGPPALLLPTLWIWFGEPRGRQLRFEQGADQLVEGFRCPPVFFFRVSGKFQVDHWHLQPHALGEGPGLVLD